MKFQSAPRDCSRGDIHPLRSPGFQPCFNPRPVIAHGAMPRRSTHRSPSQSFNPRPVIAHGAILGAVASGALVGSFNPRPVIAHGAMGCSATSRPASMCFNPRPVIAHGAIDQRDRANSNGRFQSAPRDCSRGDP